MTTRHRFYIGTVTKDGAVVGPEAWHEWEVGLLAAFGGYSRSDVHGAWRDAGKVIHEISRVYECIGLEHLDVIRRHVVDMRVRAGQECILWTHEDDVPGEFV